MPTPDATSMAVSTRAAPIEVRLAGSPRSTLTPATTPTTRIPAATITSAMATHQTDGGDDREGGCSSSGCSTPSAAEPSTVTEGRVRWGELSYGRTGALLRADRTGEQGHHHRLDGDLRFDVDLDGLPAGENRVEPLQGADRAEARRRHLDVAGHIRIHQRCG